MNIEIRKAVPEDIDLLMDWRVRVLREVFSVSDATSIIKLERENRRYYQTALKNDTHIACFVCTGNNVIGCGGICLYQEMPSPENLTGHCAYLMNIYTIPAQRGQGIGRVIVQWLVEQALQRNISKIYLESSEAGRHLYSKMGFVPMQDMMKWIND